MEAKEIENLKWKVENYAQVVASKDKTIAHLNEIIEELYNQFEPIKVKPKQEYYDNQLFDDMHNIALRLGMIADIRMDEFKREKPNDVEAINNWREISLVCTRMIGWVLTHHKEADTRERFRRYANIYQYTPRPAYENESEVANG